MTLPKTESAQGSNGARILKGSDSTSLVRYLVNIGVFAALYFVILFATGMLGVLSPAGSLVGWSIGLIANALVITLFMARTPTVWELAVLGLLVGLLMVVTGHSFLTPLTSTILGFVGGLVAATGGFANRTKNSLAYAVFSLWLIGPLLPMFWDRSGYLKYIEESMQNPAYAKAWGALFTNTTLIIWTCVVFALALGSGYLGNKMLGKHFRRAGLV